MNTTLTGNYTVNALTGEKTIAMAAGNTSGRGVAAAALPRDMTFTEENAMTVGVYSVLCGVGTIGNLTVFVTLYMNRDHLRSRINLFIVHLSIADLIVALIMMPLEIGWNSTVEWKAGDAACRILMFFRTFGFYLSSFILVAISIDRYCAIARPLSMKTAEARGRIMLIAAWILSAVASLPQGIIFHTERHPEHPWFVQCVTFNFFPNAAAELAYNMFNIITLYLFPLCVIVVLYSLIVCLMSRRARQQCEAPAHDEFYIDHPFD